MKNLWIAVLGLGLSLAAPASAQINTITQPISGVTAPEAISVATHAYTNVVSTTARALADMSGILIDNPATNTASVFGHVGNCTSTPVPTTIRGPFELSPSASGGFLALPADSCLWLISRAASAESVVVQSLRQKR